MTTPIFDLAPGQIEPLGKYTEEKFEHLYMASFELYHEGRLRKVGNYEVWLDKPFGPGSTQQITDYILWSFWGQGFDDDLSFVRLTGLFYAGEQVKPASRPGGVWMDVSGGDE